MAESIGRQSTEGAAAQEAMANPTPSPMLPPAQLSLSSTGPTEGWPASTKRDTATVSCQVASSESMGTGGEGSTIGEMHINSACQDCDEGAMTVLGCSCEVAHSRMPWELPTEKVAANQPHDNAIIGQSSALWVKCTSPEPRVIEMTKSHVMRRSAKAVKPLKRRTLGPVVKYDPWEEPW